MLQAVDSTALVNELTETTSKSMSLWDLFQAGGWLMWVLLGLGGFVVFIFAERFISIRKATQLDMNFMNRIRDYISDGRIDAALDACRRTDTPIARMIEKGIERIGRPMSDVQTAIENAANLEVAKLEKGLPYLSMISGGAPMIGFLGTVTGMIKAFFNMANAGNNVDISLLSSGIYEAMVTTVGGLIVGIVAYFAYNFLNSRIDSVTNNLNEGIDEFMDLLQQEGEE